MNKILVLAALASVLGLSASAHASQAVVPLTPTPVAADDLAVVDLVGVSLTAGANILPSSGFKLLTTGNSFTLERSVPKSTIPGFKLTTLTLPSLDIVHDASAAASLAEGARKFNVRVYFNTEFIWVEVQKANTPAAPTFNTVFFVGAPADVYSSYRTGAYANIKFANYANLKTDMQDNYASLYDPRNVRLVQYAPMKRGGLTTSYSSTD